MNISIKEPCGESWNGMEPNNDGRFCNSCAKTVIDFTGMTVPEISDYLVQNKAGSICGRIQQSKLATLQFILPKTIFTANKWKRFLAAACISFSMFLFGCDASYTTPKATTDSSMQPQPNTMGLILTPPPDTTNAVVGEMLIMDTPKNVRPPKKIICKPPQIVPNNERFVMGKMKLPVDTLEMYKDPIHKK